MFELDNEHIKKEYYRKPWDQKIGQRQLNPAFAAKSLLDFVGDTRSNVMRKKNMDSSKAPFVSGMYPDYYMTNDHFEADGWLSSRAVNSYEFKNEALQCGTVDAMQRQMLVPIHLWAKDSYNEFANFSVLDVGGGTGRFMTFLRDNYPMAEASLLDLSPFMLEEAGKNDRYYKKFAKDYDQRIKDSKYKIEDIKPLRLIQGDATAMDDIADESHEVLTCANLFSEMPAEKRMAAVKEFMRVLKPGGIVSLADVLQDGDVKE